MKGTVREIHQWRVVWKDADWLHAQSKVYSHRHDAEYRFNKISDANIFGMEILRLEHRVLLVTEPWRTVQS